MFQYIYLPPLQVYLRALPMLVSRNPGSPFSRASSFTSGPWPGVNVYPHVAALSSSVVLPDNATSQALNTAQPKEQTKSSARYLFTDQDVELLTRNAEELLQLHENFVQELRADLAPLGFLIHTQQAIEDKWQRDFMENTDGAIRVVSAKFATEVCKVFFLRRLASDRF